MSKLKLKKGDQVIVVAGKDKGKKGKVMEVRPDRAQVIVERVNVVKRHMRATREFQGGIIEKSLPLDISNVMLVCPKCSQASRIKKKKVEDKAVRVCLKCDEVVDKL